MDVGDDTRSAQGSVNWSPTSQMGGWKRLGRKEKDGTHVKNMGLVCRKNDELTAAYDWAWDAFAAKSSRRLTGLFAAMPSPPASCAANR